MSDDAATAPEEKPPVSQPEPAAEPADQTPEQIFLVSYPKIVFLYPTLIAALVMGIYMAVTKDDNALRPSLSLLFLTILGVNLVVLAFDFPRGTSLTLFFFCIAVAIGLYTLFKFNPDLLPRVTYIVKSLKPTANAAFYFIFAGILGLIFAAVAVSVRFDYWEVRPNELLHHHGLLSDLGRYSAPNLRIDKEINDVFEYLLLGSGRLILHPSNERRAIVLDNVFFITTKEKQITKMLGALQVQIRSDL